ncbi:MAG: hypothetical protein QXE18_07275 [Thermoplasmata archaeon]
MMRDHVSLLERTRNILEMYSTTRDDDDEVVMGEIIRLLERTKAPTKQLDIFLHDLARTLHKLFEFKEVCVGIQDSSDGLFRYKVVLGFRGGAQEVRRKIAYHPDEITDEKHYPSTQVGKRTRFYLSENQPFKDSEREAFNRPSALGKERESEDSMIEGDYIDVFMLDPEKEIIGWIEVSNPHEGKWPSKKTIRWLELFATIAGAVVFEREWGGKRR